MEGAWEPVSGDALDAAARGPVARAYRLGAGARLVGLGNHGGFSGARLWRVEVVGGPLCLRAWPPGDPSPERLRTIHAWMRTARQAGLSCVPAVVATPDGVTGVEHAGRLWELTTWMPGRADFREWPHPGRLEVACTALAQLHAVWSRVAPAAGPCPAVRRRLQRADEWLARIRAGWQPPADRPEADSLTAWARRAWQLVRSRMEEVPMRLAPWIDRVFSLQPCLCDVWHDHVLFDGDLVVGIIDFGAAKVDHVAVDLARLLGSLAGGDRALWQAGLRAYGRWRTLTLDEERLVAVLDETGVLIGLATWLKWLYRDGRVFQDPDAVAGRLAELVARAERG